MELFVNKLKFYNFPQNGPYVKKQTKLWMQYSTYENQASQKHILVTKDQFCTGEKIRQPTPIKAPSIGNPLSIALN